MGDDDRRLYEKPGHLIRRLQQISLALFMDETKGFDVTPVQYSAILAIRLHPGIDQTALCNIVAIDRSTIGDVVGRLERKKLIRRMPGAQDRRTKLLTILESFDSPQMGPNCLERGRSMCHYSTSHDPRTGQSTMVCG